MRRLLRFTLLFVLVCFAGCGGSSTIETVRPLWYVSPPTEMPSKDALISNRESFLNQLESLKRRDSVSAGSDQSSFYKWSVAGIVIGAGGTFYGVFSNSDDNNRKVAQSTSIVSGAITALLTLFHFEASAKDHETANEYLQQKILEFKTKWADISLPSTREELNAYLLEQQAILDKRPGK